MIMNKIKPNPKSPAKYMLPGAASPEALLAITDGIRLVFCIKLNDIVGVKTFPIIKVAAIVSPIALPIPREDCGSNS